MKSFLLAVMLILFTSFSLNLPYANGHNSYNNWKYYRAIEIENPYNVTLKDHQVLIRINTKSLILDGKMRQDCGDIRFSDDLGNPLSYWIQSGCNTSETRIWVRVPVIQPGGTTIYMYYGNGEASSESNEWNTMDKGRLYGGSGDDEFFDSTAMNGYIYAVGNTSCEGSGGYDALIVKFDQNLTPIIRKIYGGSGDDVFYSVFPQGNYIYAVGYTSSEGSGGYSALIVKFDQNLNVVAAKIYGGNSYDWFYGVTGDGSYIYAVGYTWSEGSGNYDGLIVKFDQNLNIIARKVYGGSGYYIEGFHEACICGGKLFTVGTTISEGFGGQDALILEFNPEDLSIVARKVYGGSGYDYFYNIFSASGYIYAVGSAGSIGFGGQDALIVKFDQNLNVVAAKIYGGNSYDWFHDLTYDGNYIYASGYTTSQGAGGFDITLVKFDQDLNLIDAKIYGGSGDDWSSGIYYYKNYLYICGYTKSKGAGNKDALIVQLSDWMNYKSMTEGLVYQNASLSLENSPLNLAESNLNLENSNLNLQESFLSLQNSTLGMENLYLRKLPDLPVKVGGEREVNPPKEKKHPILASNPQELACYYSFKEYPRSHSYVASKVDYHFNEDILANLNGYILGENWTGLGKPPFLYLGGPDDIPFQWRLYDIKFVREEGTFNSLIFKGKYFKAVYGEKDYSVVLVNCEGGDVRIAGITRYGTRAGLIWSLYNVKSVKESGLYLIKWEDVNHNGKVDIFEIGAVSIAP